MEENIEAGSITLTSGELSDIHSTLEEITVAGDRYPEELEKRTGLCTTCRGMLGAGDGG